MVCYGMLLIMDYVFCVRCFAPFYNLLYSHFSVVRVGIISIAIVVYPLVCELGWIRGMDYWVDGIRMLSRLPGGGTSLLQTSRRLGLEWSYYLLPLLEGILN